MADRFEKMARAELAWILAKTDARDIRVEAFERMEAALRRVAEETRRKCAEVARKAAVDYAQAGGFGGDFAYGAKSAAQSIQTAIESLDLGTAPNPLTAAAPDMLAALERQADNIERWRKTGIPAGPEESRSIYEQIKSVIAKAKGVSHG